MDSVEHLIVGAGPAGLRSAQVLAEAGREVLVAEKRAEIGPKTCAGGLTPKSRRLLHALGLPDGAGLLSEGHATFLGEQPHALDVDLAAILTLRRRDLGAHQRRWAEAAGAEVAGAAAVTDLDLPNRRARVGGRSIAWRHLIGADGADSGVRRALGLASPRRYFAGEYNVPGLRLEPLRIECAPGRLANGYFWVFPHGDYTSIGAVGDRTCVRPMEVRRVIEERADALGVDLSDVPFEGATLEVEYRGLHFAGQVHLAGDAAGLPSALTAEGIYAALVSGEDVARAILDPRHRALRTEGWLRVKRRHDRLARWLARRSARAIVFPLLAGLARLQAARRPLAGWFLSG